MSKVIIFSRYFPSYHPRKGERTDFVEKIIKGLPNVTALHPAIFTGKYGYNCNLLQDNSITPKWHTIRAGNRWKIGDKFSPRIWSDKPYRSKQITIGPDIEIKKIWTFEIYGMTELLNNLPINNLTTYYIAKNDGLPLTDFLSWFKPPFIGQIICWNTNIKY